MHLFCAIGKWPKLEANGANVKFMRGGGEWRQIRPTCYIFFGRENDRRTDAFYAIFS